jgi:predicted MFS family arabinose efflux permease
MMRRVSAPRANPGVPPPVDAGRSAWFVMGLLMLTTALNVADRNLLSILVRPIQAELDVSDTAMGLLGGFWFAVVHNAAIFPVARLADRGNRRSIIASGLFLWSGFTAISGFVQGYWQLLLARMGVSAAESTGSAPVHSLLSDYFPIHQRATALGLISVGGVAGIGIGLAVGGIVAQAYGWRAAFFAFGAPGLVLALVLRATVREPERGGVDGIAAGVEPVPIGEVVRYLRARRSYVQMVLASAFHAFAGMGTSFWYPAYLGRIHGLDLAAVGLGYALVGPALSAVGALVGGRLADHLGRREPRWYMWIPALSALIALPSTIAFVLWPAGSTFELAGRALPVALLVVMPSSFFGGMWTGPTLAMTQTIARPRMRAMASAATTGTYNLIGLGLGPTLVGLLSDGLTPSFGVEALRYALLVVGLAHVLGSLHNWLAARSLRGDLEVARAG